MRPEESFGFLRAPSASGVMPNKYIPPAVFSNSFGDDRIVAVIREYWEKYKAAAGLPPDAEYAASYHFELTESAADALLALVLAGKKRATCSSVTGLFAGGEALPRVGDVNILTDWAGAPRCIIRTTAVTILPFCEMTFGIAVREGEDDTLESWRAGHERFFRAEAAGLGYDFTPDMPVVFEDFDVVFGGQ